MSSYETHCGMSVKDLATPQQELVKIGVEMYWVLNVLRNQRCGVVG